MKYYGTNKLNYTKNKINNTFVKEKALRFLLKGSFVQHCKQMREQIYLTRFSKRWTKIPAGGFWKD